MKFVSMALISTTDPNIYRWETREQIVEALGPIVGGSFPNMCAYAVAALEQMPKKPIVFRVGGK